MHFVTHLQYTEMEVTLTIGTGHSTRICKGLSRSSSERQRVLGIVNAKSQGIPINLYGKIMPVTMCEWCFEYRSQVV